MTDATTIEVVSFTPVGATIAENVSYDGADDYCFLVPYSYPADPMASPADWYYYASAGDSRDKLLWKRLIGKTETEEAEREEYRRKYPKGASVPNRCRRWVGCRGWDARYGYKHLRTGKLHQFPPPANTTPEIRARRAAMVEPGPWEWDKMVGYGAVRWAPGPDLPKLPAYTTLEDLFYWHPPDPDYKNRTRRWVRVGGYEHQDDGTIRRVDGHRRRDNKTVWHVPEHVAERFNDAMSSAREARELAQLRGCDDEKRRDGKMLKTIEIEILPLRGVAGARSVVKKKIDLSSPPLHLHPDDRSVAATVPPPPHDPTSDDRLRRALFSRIYHSTDELDASTSECIYLIEERLASGRPWTRAERREVAELLLDRITKYRRVKDVKRHKFEHGPAKRTLERLEKGLERGDVVVPRVDTIRDLLRGLKSLQKERSAEESARGGESLTAEIIREVFGKELWEAYDEESPSERELREFRERFNVAMRGLLPELYEERCYTFGQGPNARTKVTRSGVLWDGLSKCSKIPKAERAQHLGDAYYALYKEYEKSPEAVPLEDREALAEWALGVVRRTGGYTQGEYGNDVQVASSWDTERSRRSRAYLSEDESARYIDETLNKAMEGADFELADDGDPVHEILAAQELRQSLRGGEPDIEALMMVPPVPLAESYSPATPGYHYVNGETYHMLAQLFEYDNPEKRDQTKLGSVTSALEGMWERRHAANLEGEGPWSNPPVEKGVRVWGSLLERMEHGDLLKAAPAPEASPEAA